MAEQLGLQEVVRERAAEDGDERLRFPVAVVVDRAGDQFLPRPALALDEDRRVGVEHAADRLEHLAHARALADDLVEAVDALHLLPEVAVLFAEGVDALRVLDGDGGLVREGFEEGQVVAREAPALRHRVEVDRADLPTPQPQRDASDGLDLLQHDALGGAVPLVGGGLVEEHGLARPQHLAHDARRERLHAVELAVGEVAAGADGEGARAAFGSVLVFEQHEAALGLQRLHRDLQHGFEQRLGLLHGVDERGNLGERFERGLRPTGCGRAGGGGSGGRHTRSGKTGGIAAYSDLQEWCRLTERGTRPPATGSGCRRRRRPRGSSSSRQAPAPL